MSEGEIGAFSGILGSVRFEDGDAILRFYPFHFSTAPNARPVFVLHFESIAFTEADVAPLINDEVEVSAFETKAELFSYMQHAHVDLYAASVAARWEEYDRESLLARITQLDALYEDANVASGRASQKNQQGLELVRELIRRAQVKAEFSEHLKDQQRSAMAVLQRLLTHFENR